MMENNIALAGRNSTPVWWDARFDALLLVSLLLHRCFSGPFMNRQPQGINGLILSGGDEACREGICLAKSREVPLSAPDI